MKALVVRQPWASLIAHGIKTIETRGFAPRTSIRPGDQIAIVAGKAALPPVGPIAGTSLFVKHLNRDPKAPKMLGGYTDGPWLLPMPQGIVVTVATYDEALPCVDDPTPEGQPVHERCLFTDNTLRLFSEDWDFIVEAGGCAPAHTAKPLPDQLPLGDFTPGRYGWLLSNPQRMTRPVPCPAKRPDGSRTVMQGVFTLPDDVLEHVTPQLNQGSKRT